MTVFSRLLALYLLVRTCCTGHDSAQSADNVKLSCVVRDPSKVALARNSRCGSDHNSLLIYGSLKKPTIDRFARVTHWSTGISMVACLTMALAGYLTFGDKTQGNILNNFPTNNILVNVARL